MIGNESVGQTKVDYYSALWMAAFGFCGIEILHYRNMISKAAFDGGSVTVGVAVLLIVNYTYMSYNITSMAFHIVTP